MSAYKIIVSGEGGQGVLSIAKIIAHSSWEQGRTAVFMPFFSTEKQGGISTAFTQVGDGPIPFPKFEKADLWVALSQRAVGRIRGYLKDDSVVIVDTHLVKDLSGLKKWKPYAIDATRMAKEDLGEVRAFNMIIMGAMLNFLPGVTPEGFARSIEKQFADKYGKKPELRELNQKAFEMGFGLIKGGR